MPGYFYILQSETNGHYYMGSTLDPDGRLARHNANAVSATRGKGPWKRVALASFASSATAKKAEAFVKRQKSRRIIELIISGDFIWSDEFPR